VVEGSLARERPAAALRVEPWSRADLPRGGCVCGSHRVFSARISRKTHPTSERSVSVRSGFSCQQSGSGLANENRRILRGITPEKNRLRACVAELAAAGAHTSWIQILLRPSDEGESSRRLSVAKVTGWTDRICLFFSSDFGV
jgi:hypothetical protein